MGTCKLCGSEYSLWAARGDGLCPNCGKKEDNQKTQRQLEDAKIRLKEIVEQIAPGDEIDTFGIALWDTMGSKLSSTFHLWVGRFLLGMFGDMLHSKTRILGVFAISCKGFLYTGKIGESGSVDPTSILNSTLEVKSVTKTSIGEVAASHSGETLEVTVTGNKRLRATFPKCFLKENECIPNKIISILKEQQKMNIR